jgi:hypothetical protein
MSGRITSNPKRQHHCNAGWRVESAEEAAAREARAEDGTEWGLSLPKGQRIMIEEFARAPAGSIWTCDECGQEWKATYPYLNVFAPTWVKKPRPWRLRILKRGAA